MKDNIDKRPKIGIVTPKGRVSPEATSLYGKEVAFIATNANVKTLTPKGYEDAIKNIPSAVDQMVKDGVEAVSIMGTSLTFFRGRAFNEELQKSIAEQTGLPTSTMTTAIVNGLKILNAKNIAIATVYSEEVNNLLTRVLEEYDINPLNLESNATDISDLYNVTTESIVELGSKAVQNIEADALLISCGGLRTLEATKLLEDKLGIPVVSSSIAGAWDSVRLVGHSGFSEIGGKLLEAGR